MNELELPLTLGRDLGDEIYDYSLCKGGGGGIVAVVT